MTGQVCAQSFSLTANVSSHSPDGTYICATAGSLTTAQGTWSFGSVDPNLAGYYQILLNGTFLPGSYANQMVVQNGGQLFVYGNGWYVWNPSAQAFQLSTPNPIPPACP
jgi:hypothetical protein